MNPALADRGGGTEQTASGLDDRLYYCPVSLMITLNGTHANRNTDRGRHYRAVPCMALTITVSACPVRIAVAQCDALALVSVLVAS